MDQYLQEEESIRDLYEQNIATASGHDRQQISVSAKVFKSILERFFSYTRYKILKILSSSRQSQLIDSLQSGKDGHLDYIVSSMCAVANHQLASVCNFLKLWYIRSRHKKIIIDSKLSLVYLLEIKNYTLEVIYIRTLGEIFELVGDKASELDENTVDDLQSFIYSSLEHLAVVFKNMPNNYVQFLRLLYSKLLCRLFHLRFYECNSYLIMRLGQKRTIEESTSLEHVIRSLQSLQLKLFPIDELQATGYYLREIQAMAISGKKQIQPLAESLDLMIANQLFNITTNLTYESNTPLLQEYVQVSFARDLRKMNPTTRLQIITSTLCVSDNKVFIAKWSELLPSTLSLINSSTTNTATSLLPNIIEFVQKGMWVYTYRVGAEGNQETLNKFSLIAKKLFDPKRTHAKAFLYTSVSPQILCDIIIFMSEHWLSFVVNNILYPILKSTAYTNKKDYNANSHISSNNYNQSIYLANVALLSYLAITIKLDTKKRPPFPANPTQPAILDFLNDSNPSNVVKNRVMEEYENTFLTHIERLIVLVHAEYLSLVEILGVSCVRIEKQAASNYNYQPTPLSSASKFASDIRFPTESTEKFKIVVGLYETLLKCVPRFIDVSSKPKNAFSRQLIRNTVSILYGPILSLRQHAFTSLVLLLWKSPSASGVLIFESITELLSDTSFSAEYISQSSLKSQLNYFTLLLDQLLPRVVIKQYLNGPKDDVNNEIKLAKGRNDSDGSVHKQNSVSCNDPSQSIMSGNNSHSEDVSINDTENTSTTHNVKDMRNNITATTSNIPITKELIYNFNISLKTSVNSLLAKKIPTIHKKNLSDPASTSTFFSQRVAVPDSQLSSFPISKLSDSEFEDIKNAVEQTLLLLLCDNLDAHIKLKLIKMAYHIYAISRLRLSLTPSPVICPTLYTLIVKSFSKPLNDKQYFTSDTIETIGNLKSIFHPFTHKSDNNAANFVFSNTESTSSSYSLNLFNKELIHVICDNVKDWHLHLLQLLRGIKKSDFSDSLKHLLVRIFHKFLDMSLALEQKFVNEDILNADLIMKNASSLSLIDLNVPILSPVPNYLCIAEESNLFKTLNSLSSTDRYFNAKNHAGDITGLSQTEENDDNDNDKLHYNSSLSDFYIDQESNASNNYPKREGYFDSHQQSKNQIREADHELNGHHAIRNTIVDDDQDVDDADQLLNYLTKKNPSSNQTNKAVQYTMPNHSTLNMESNSLEIIKKVPFYTKWINFFAVIASCVCVNDLWDDAILSSPTSTDVSIHGAQVLFKGLLNFLWVNNKKFTDTLITIMSTFDQNSFVIYFSAITMHLSLLNVTSQVRLNKTKHVATANFAKLILMLLKNTQSTMERDLFHAKAAPMAHIYIQLCIQKYKTSTHLIPYDNDEITFQYYFSLWLLDYTEFGTISSLIATDLIHLYSYFYYYMTKTRQIFDTTNSDTSSTIRSNLLPINQFPPSDLKILQKSFLSRGQLFYKISNNPNKDYISPYPSSNISPNQFTHPQQYSTHNTKLARRNKINHKINLQKAKLAKRKQNGPNDFPIFQWGKRLASYHDYSADLENISNNSYSNGSLNNLMERNGNPDLNIELHSYSLLKTLKRLLLLTENCEMAILTTRTFRDETNTISGIKDVFICKFYNNDIIQLLFLILEESSPNLQKIGISLMSHFLYYKSNEVLVLEYLVYCAHYSSKGISDGIFFGVARLLQNSNYVKKLGITKVVILLITKLGDPVLKVRIETVKTINNLIKYKFFGVGMKLLDETVGLHSELHTSIVATQHQYIKELANKRKDMAIFAFIEIYNLIFTKYNHSIMDKHWHRPLLNVLAPWLGHINMERDLKYCPAFFDWLFNLTCEFDDSYGGKCADMWGEVCKDDANHFYLLNLAITNSSVYTTHSTTRALIQKIIVYISKPDSCASLNFLIHQLDCNFMFNPDNRYKIYVSKMLYNIQAPKIKNSPNSSPFSNGKLESMSAYSNRSSRQLTPSTSFSKKSKPSLSINNVIPGYENIENNKSPYNSYRIDTPNQALTSRFNSLMISNNILNDKIRSTYVHNVFTMLSGSMSESVELSHIFVTNFDAIIKFVSDILFNTSIELKLKQIIYIFHAIFITIDQISISSKILCHRLIASLLKSHQAYGKTERALEFITFLLDEKNTNYTSDGFKTYFTPFSNASSITSFSDIILQLISTLEDIFVNLPPINKDILSIWTETAVDWSLSCPPTLLLGLKSWQLVRIMVKKLDINLVVVLLGRIYMVYSTRQTFNYKLDPLNRLMFELLQTLNHLLKLASIDELDRYPQLFFIGFLFLQTNDLIIWNLFSQFLKRWITHSMIPSNFASMIKKYQWTSFKSVYRLAGKGLTHSRTYTRALKLYCAIFIKSAGNELNLETLRDHLTRTQLIDPKAILKMVLEMLIYLLPRALNEFQSHSKQVIDTFQIICNQFNFHKCTNIAKLLQLYIKFTFQKSSKHWVDLLCQYINDEIQPDDDFISATLNNLYLTYRAKIYPHEVLIICGSIYKNIYATQSNASSSLIMNTEENISPFILFSKALLGREHVEESLTVINDLMQIDKNISPNIGNDLCETLLFDFSIARKTKSITNNENEMLIEEDIGAEKINKDYKNYMRTFENNYSESAIMSPSRQVNYTNPNETYRPNLSSMQNDGLNEHNGDGDGNFNNWTIKSDLKNDILIPLQETICSFITTISSLNTSYDTINRHSVSPLYHWSFKSLIADWNNKDNIISTNESTQMPQQHQGPSHMEIIKKQSISKLTPLLSSSKTDSHIVTNMAKEPPPIDIAHKIIDDPIIVKPDLFNDITNKLSVHAYTVDTLSLIINDFESFLDKY